MKIIRNGKAIKLTKAELIAAYDEQTQIYDIMHIRNNMDVYLNEDEYKVIRRNRNIKKFIETAADELRCNQDKYGMNYESALKEAFNEAKSMYLEK